ncbi:hypothetical protein [Streptomyces aidingensis]|uniref:hypothetical protein n=1 Tax=Streptomyces aidingensis TaxID=910347 RepID=UPI000B80B9B3|nr:hypothetical protein [Streptomyces aidingensis]
MGIEGERLVLDYLSKVGDLAQATSMSANERRQLVTRLRDEIGRRRSAVTGEEKGEDVRRILRGMGRPEDVVADASGRAAGAPPAPRAMPEVPAAGEAPEASEVPLVPRSRPARDAPAGEPRAEAAWPAGRIGGFVGGITVPEMLNPEADTDEDERLPAAREPAADRDPGQAGEPRPERGPDGEGGHEHDDRDGDGDGAGAGADEGERPGPARRGPRIPRLSLRKSVPRPEAEPERPPPPPPPQPVRKASRARRGARALRRAAGGRHAGGFFELLAVALLLGGTVLRNVLALIAGWLIAYWAPRLTRTEAKIAVFGGLGGVFGGYVIWLFGRMNGYWGDPVAEDAIPTGLSENFPLLLRLAAVASALFLLWRALRRPPAKG